MAHSGRMRLSSEAVREFKEIYEQEFGEILSDAKVEETALRLLRFFKLLLLTSDKDGSSPPQSDLPSGTHKR